MKHLILLPVLIICVILFDIFRLKKHKLRILFKGMATLSILLTAVLFSQPGFYVLFVIIGLSLSLLGDILLEFYEDGNVLFFNLGGAAFGLAHLCYITAFISATGFSTAQIFPTVLFFGLGAIIFFLIKPKEKEKIPLVGGYVLLLSFMLSRAFSAFYTDIALNIKLLISSGALLFFFSDLTLAVDWFKKPIKYIVILNSWLYFPAQFLLALSAVFILI